MNTKKAKFWARSIYTYLSLAYTFGAKPKVFSRAKMDSKTREQWDALRIRVHAHLERTRKKYKNASVYLEKEWDIRAQKVQVIMSHGPSNMDLSFVQRQVLSHDIQLHMIQFQRIYAQFKKLWSLAESRKFPVSVLSCFEALHAAFCEDLMRIQFEERKCYFRLDHSGDEQIQLLYLLIDDTFMIDMNHFSLPRMKAGETSSCT